MFDFPLPSFPRLQENYPGYGHHPRSGYKHGSSKRHKSVYLEWDKNVKRKMQKASRKRNRRK